MLLGGNIVISVGILRLVDSNGKVTLPIEIRNSFNIKDNDSVEFFTEGKTLVLKKYDRSCLFCGEANDIYMFKGKNICKKCLNDFKGKNKKL